MLPIQINVSKNLLTDALLLDYSASATGKEAIKYIHSLYYKNTTKRKRARLV